MDLAAGKAAPSADLLRYPTNKELRSIPLENRVK